MEKNNEEFKTGCCPRFNPEPWENKKIKWKDKLFVKDRVFCIFHFPLNFGKIVTKNMKMIENADALLTEPLMLSDENSLWGSDIYIAVGKEVQGAKMKKISGTFLTKVFEGSYSNLGKWVKETKEYVKSKNREIKKMYFFYTTCPECAKVYSENYTVILAEI